MNLTDWPSLLKYYEALFEKAMLRRADLNKKRSTMTEAAALLFQIYYDHALEEMKKESPSNIRISNTTYRYTVSTLHRTLCDGLKWHTEYQPDENLRNNYRILRTRIAFVMTEDGVEISFRSQAKYLGKSVAYKDTIEDTKLISNWKEQFFNWLNEPVGTFALKNLALEPSDIQLVEEHCRVHSVTVDVDFTHITCMK